MPRPLPEKTLGVMLDAIRAAPGGCAPAELATRLNPKPPERNLQRWLAALVKQKRVVRAGGGKFTRYRMAGPNDIVSDLAPGVQPFVIRKGSVEAAIERLVTRPLADRPRCEYQRAWLDAYDPNHTWYLSKEIRDLLQSAPGVKDGAAKLKDSGFHDRLVEDMALAALVFEGEKVTREMVKQFLARNDEDKPTSRAMQLAWNQRGALRYVVGWLGKLAFSEVLTGGCDWVDSGLYPMDEFGEPAVRDSLRSGPWLPHDLGGVVRPAPLPDSAYEPPSDPILIRACFEQIAATAGRIMDPFEAAFFLFVHLLYLQPFTFNPATACMAVNVPLLCDNVLPMTFVTIPAPVFRKAVRGVCELNQIDLLREVFLQAYFDGVGVPKTHRYWR